MLRRQGQGGKLVEEVLIVGGLLLVQCVLSGYVVFTDHLLALGADPLAIIVVGGAAYAAFCLPFAVALERKRWPSKVSGTLVAQYLLIALGGSDFESQNFLQILIERIADVNQDNCVPRADAAGDQEDDAGKVDAFTSLLWPHGNTAFRDSIEAFAKGMLEMEQAVQKMVLESLGVQEEHVNSYLASLVYFIRLLHFGAPPAGSGDDEAMYAVAHKDSTVVTTIAQHEVEGLEVQARDGTWISVAPEPGTLAVFAGELLTVVTNGRVPACVHRVRTPSKRDRLSVLFGSEPQRGAVVSALEDLVDHGGGHPLRFRPCDFNEFVKFRFGREWPASYNIVEEFCGIDMTK